METSAVTSTAASGALGGNRTAEALGGEDFFKLLIAQLSNQDPLEPTSNEELLQQISSIRDIELSTALVESLQSLTGQQQYGSAASLIGRYVAGRSDDSGGQAVPLQGTVVGVRFAEDGTAFLQLNTGRELSMANLESVAPTEQAASALVGQMVTGFQANSSGETSLVQGVVTGVTTADDGNVMLELDTGENLDFRYMISSQDMSAASSEALAVG